MENREVTRVVSFYQVLNFICAMLLIFIHYSSYVEAAELFERWLGDTVFIQVAQLQVWLLFVTISLYLPFSALRRGGEDKTANKNVILSVFASSAMVLITWVGVNTIIQNEYAFFIIAVMVGISCFLERVIIILCNRFRASIEE